jgi:hypothetical protein
MPQSWPTTEERVDGRIRRNLGEVVERSSPQFDPQIAIF